MIVGGNEYFTTIKIKINHYCIEKLVYTKYIPNKEYKMSNPNKSFAAAKTQCILWLKNIASIIDMMQRKRRKR